MGLAATLVKKKDEEIAILKAELATLKGNEQKLKKETDKMRSDMVNMEKEKAQLKGVIRKLQQQQGLTDRQKKAKMTIEKLEEFTAHAISLVQDIQSEVRGVEEEVNNLKTKEIAIQASISSMEAVKQAFLLDIKN